MNPGHLHKEKVKVLSSSEIQMKVLGRALCVPAVGTDSETVVLRRAIASEMQSHHGSLQAVVRAVETAPGMLHDMMVVAKLRNRFQNAHILEAGWEMGTAFCSLALTVVARLLGRLGRLLTATLEVE